MRALVTGGCRGLGETFTHELIKRGYTVYAVYNKSVSKALDLEDEYTDKIKCIKCDIKDEKEVESLFFNIDDIDLLINNAAISHDNNLIDKSKKEFMSVLETNLVGNFLVTKEALSKLNNDGIIINISSNNALDNFNPVSMDYDASKAGVNILTKDFNEVLKSLNKNQKIVSICPGWINTESVKRMNPDYLKMEMKKSNQDKILEPNELVSYILDNVMNYNSGDIIEIKEV